MNVLSPLALLGLLGLGLPLLAHLLGRERPQTIRFAGMRFAAAEDPVITQRRSIRDWPLLILRLLLLAVLVLVLARPVVGSEAAVAVLAEPHDAVVLLDASASMELRVDGRSDRVRARERLDQLLDALPAGSRVGLVISDPRAPAVELEGIADNAGRIRAAVDGWMESSEAGPRAGAWTLSEALPRATGQLGERSGEARPRVVYALGDPTDRGLGSLPAVAEGAITVIPVPTRGKLGEAPAPTPEHVGIRELEWEPAPELDPRALRIHAVIHRHGGEPDNELEVEAALELGDREVGRARVSVAADADAALAFTHTLDGEQGETRARVRIIGREDDPLPIDDRRHLWLSISDDVEVLVVNGDPSEARANDEIFFLSTALANSDLGDRLSLRGLTEDQLEQRVREAERDASKDPLAGVDLLIFANARAVEADVAAKVSARVREGMGLLISVGDRVSATDYNARFGEVLPLLLREAVFAGTAPGRTEARSEALAPVQLSHPIFAGLSGEDELVGDLDLGTTRTRRMFLLEPDPRRGADIALAFSSGAPALITRAAGRGRVALLTTTVDRDWGDLPLRPGFVPLVTRTATWLASAEGGSQGSVVGVGASKALARPQPYTVTTPEGRVVPVTPNEGEPARFDATDLPGHYLAEPGVEAVEAAGASAADSAEDGELSGVERFVVAVDSRESQTAGVELAAVEVAEGGESGTVTIYEPRWRELAMLVLLLLGIESVVRGWQAQRRKGARS
ncbi:VWA domain-containing protein [Pseudenhygromyxa sp. WMMC2535]|uniref:BatA domain-containing protein n=1 Tax=Pseudenhygromyxa sp. WMMC2535 TaxID=2712867 RepID=UPI0015581043|nr:VWA domain-containing protein [Pseudenhygromyxa sp. WMMC2535]